MEIWKDIKGYEGLYQISNLGRVKSLRKQKGFYIREEVILKNRIDRGYLKVTLSKDNKLKYISVHRLIAEAFIPNPENKSFIDHINGNRADNRIENLRWVTQKENMNNPITRKRESNSKKGEKNPQYQKPKTEKQLEALRKSNIKSVICIETKEVFESIEDASKKYNITASNISRCCNGIRKTAGGKHWKFI